MHDGSINRTMINKDGTEIEEVINVSEHTFEYLKNNFKYRSTNIYYQTPINTLEEYINACKMYNICPIIQLSLNNSDMDFVYNRLGDNFIVYEGNFSYARSLSNNILCLTSREGTDEEIEAYLLGIGGRVGISRLADSKLTDSLISLCRKHKWEVMASYAYEKSNISKAINKGATIILSDNVGKDVDHITASSFVSWENYTHNGIIDKGNLILANSQYVTFTGTKKGNYKISAKINGNGTFFIDGYNTYGYHETTEVNADGYFIYTVCNVDYEEMTFRFVSNGPSIIEYLIIQ